MDDKLISIRNGAVPIGHHDRRCRRTDCIFPKPTVRFDLEGGRIVAAWSWVGVRVVTVTNGVKIRVLPSLLLVTISCN